jgi:hypothetical protein
MEWKSKVNVEFKIYGHDIVVNEINDILKIKPTKAANKDDQNNFMMTKNKIGYWIIETGYEISYDSIIQIEKIIKKLLSKKNKLKTIKEKWNCEYYFCLVVNVYDNNLPALYLTSDSIKFIGDIGASYDIDLYNYTEC